MVQYRHQLKQLKKGRDMILTKFFDRTQILNKKRHKQVHNASKNPCFLFFPFKAEMTDQSWLH